MGKSNKSCTKIINEKFYNYLRKESNALFSNRKNTCEPLTTEKLLKAKRLMEKWNKQK